MDDDEDVEERETDEDNFLSATLKLQSLAVKTNYANKFIALGYLQCYFFSMAVILGNGTVGLPRVLSQSGFTVYVVMILLQTFIQILIVFYYVELLQHGKLAKRKELHEETAFPGDEDILLNDVEGAVGKEEENKATDMKSEINRNNHNNCEKGDPVPLSVLENQLNALHSQTSLHTLAELFLGNGLRQIFELAILLFFISLLINYALEASQLCGQLLDINLVCILAVFVWGSAFLTIFVDSCIVPFVSVVTFLNGCLLFTIAVCASLFIGSQFNPKHIQREFKHVGQPFVLGTVALGVAVNILPVLFRNVQPSALQIRGFCWSVIAGVLTCVAISIFWVARNGNISAILVAEIVKSKFPEYSWIVILLQVFVVISVTVSFLAIATGMKHMVDSWFESFYSSTQTNWQEIKCKWKGVYCRANIRWFLKVTILISLFGLVFAVATLNPQGTGTVLESVASLALTIELGVCTIPMLRRSQDYKFSHLKVPVPLSRYLYHLRYFVLAYFLVSLGFNVADIIQSTLYNQTSAARVQFSPNQTLTTFNVPWDNSSLLNLHNRRWRVKNMLTNETL